MKDFKDLSQEEKKKVSAYIKRAHAGYLEERPNSKRDVSDFMNSFYQKLVKALVDDEMIAEEFTIKQEDFDNEIVKSLYKIYSEQIKGIVDLFTNPEVTYTSRKEKEALKNFFTGKATAEQIKILVRSYQKKKSSARIYGTSKGKAKKKKTDANYNANPVNQAKKKELNRLAYLKKKEQQAAAKNTTKKTIENTNEQVESSITDTSNVAPISQIPLPTVQQNQNPPASTATINNPGSGFPDSLPVNPPIPPHPSTIDAIDLAANLERIRKERNRLACAKYRKKKKQEKVLAAARIEQNPEEAVITSNTSTSGVSDSPFAPLPIDVNFTSTPSGLDTTTGLDIGDELVRAAKTMANENRDKLVKTDAVRENTKLTGLSIPIVEKRTLSTGNNSSQKSREGQSHPKKQKISTPKRPTL